MVPLRLVAVIVVPVRAPVSVPPLRGRKDVPHTSTHWPLPSDLNVMASPGLVTMFAPPGIAIDAELTIVQAPANRHSRIRPETAVPRELMVAVPVI